MLVKMMDAAAVADKIKDSDTVAISGGGYRVTPESLVEALADRFARTASPRNLTFVAVAMVERSRAGQGGQGTGLNRVAQEGLMAKIITSSFARSSHHELNRMIVANRVAAYDLPMGTLIQLLRATSAGRKGFATPVGIGTFVDPRLQGGRMSGLAEQDICKVIEVEGEEQLYYPRLPVNVALIKASAADDRGNLYYDNDAFDHGVLECAMAAHQSGGRVYAEVNRIVARGEIHPRMGKVPGRLVHGIVVQSETFEDEQDPNLTGASFKTLPSAPTRNLPRDLIARIAVSRVGAGDMVNLGAGIPMYEVPEAARLMGRDDIFFTVEQGPLGGWPKAGGVARNPEIIWDQHEVFQFYEGGGPDLSILSFGEIDQFGNVNVSRFSGMLPGCGGFINIVHGVQRLFFCGTLTTGGLEEKVTPEGLRIVQEGQIRRFVEDVEQINFNAIRGLAAGKRASIITDRGIFDITTDGLVLTDIMPGIELQRDLLDHIVFPVHVASNLREIDRSLLDMASFATWAA